MENYTSDEARYDPYGFHEGHWEGDDFDQAIDLALGEEFLYGKTDLAQVTSMGMHIGSATTHLTVSKLTLRTGGRSVSSKSVVKTKEVVYESPVIRTPYREDGSLDTEHVSRFLEDAYNAARLIPDLIETGVVVMSGKASEERNRLALQRLFASQKERLLFLTEGPNLQGILAALAAGATERSGRQGKRILNVDLGAEGARLAWIANGTVSALGSFRGGAKVLESDEEGKLKCLDEVGQIMAAELGLDLKLFKPVTRSERQVVGKALADTLLDYLEEGSLSELGRRLVSALPPSAPEVDLVQFSGGVAEYVYGFESEPQADVGYEWGGAIRKRAPKLGLKMRVETPPVRLRATPIGTAPYLLCLSPQDVYSSHGHLHPLKGLVVVSPRFRSGLREPAQAQQDLEQGLALFGLLDGSKPFALSMDYVEERGSYEAVATGIFSALQYRLSDHDVPLVLVGATEAPSRVAQMIASRAGENASLVAISGLHVHDLDFVDVGEVEHETEVPVMVRSLVFR